MTITRAVIPAAGLGTRLFPATKSQPKEMLPLGTRPTIQGVAEELVAADLRDILIITGRNKRAIEDHFDPSDGIEKEDKCALCAEIFDPSRVRFYYTRQVKPRGLGDAVSYARSFVGDEPFAVALGDCWIMGPERASLLRRMIQVYGDRDAAATIAVQTVPLEATSRYGIVAPEGTGDSVALRLRDVVEKPGPEKAPSSLAICARYILSPVLFDHLAQVQPGHGGEVQLTDALRSMIRAGLPVYAVPLSEDEERLDVGGFESYARAFMRVMLTHPEYGIHLRAYTAELLERLREKESRGPASNS